MYKNRDVSDYINDILTAISDVESFTRGMSRLMANMPDKTLSNVFITSPAGNFYYGVMKYGCNSLHNCSGTTGQMISLCSFSK